MSLPNCQKSVTICASV